MIEYPALPGDEIIVLSALMAQKITPNELSEKGLLREDFHHHGMYFDAIQRFVNNGGGSLSQLVQKENISPGRELGVYNKIYHHPEIDAAALDNSIEALKLASAAREDRRRKDHERIISQQAREEEIARLSELVGDITSLSNDDAGNAERFHKACGEEYRYNRDSGRWLKWNGTRWQEGDDECTQSYILTMSVLMRQASITIDNQSARAIVNHALKSRDLPRIKAALEIARSIPGTCLLYTSPSPRDRG